MDQPDLQTLQLDDIRLRVALQGPADGPLVIFCHGWPESWYSWRAQMAAVAGAGWRAVAPDMRGYGGSDAPDDPEHYTQLHHVGDLVGLLKALSATSAVLVGHDWGAPTVWHAALLRPDLFRAVVGMSVPYSPPGRFDLLSAMDKQGVSNFYMQYFQTPGVAEAELERDVLATIRRVHFSGSGDAPAAAGFGLLKPGAGFLGNSVDPGEQLPAWMNAADLAYYAGEFSRTGFRGGLNWYRAIRRNTALLAPWRGAVIRQPALFIAGERDGVLRFPASKAQIERFSQTLPCLRGCHILPGAGHWIQRERAAQVNTLLLDFLASLGR
ncbi:MAG: hypothetical protein RIQ60_1833 [Pseudomonadota bacterium]|jgi:pimeloyl-ACP methyl ester carboxylesterase